jgi:hypothetical protein
VTFATLAAPILLATIINVFAFAGLWQADRIEKRTGVTPWWVAAASLVFGVPLVAFLYYARARTLSGAVDIFCTALAAQGMGAAGVYYIVQGLISIRDETWKERAPVIFGGAFILFFIGLVAFKG